MSLDHHPARDSKPCTFGVRCNPHLLHNKTEGLTTDRFLLEALVGILGAPF